ncbi:Fur family transcriptional regulator [Actinotalea sp. C106]|uniref:Fur family transcriptional regulator n=1 Tax=Actinotalea sp. C106 TaxID=2908644 RepID=UPI0020280E82|nr:Fur family transcriptional regulator [Actinotalea sp. C106]
MADDVPTRLRAAGLRVTSPRVAVYGALEAARLAGRHLTAAEVAEQARAQIGAVSTQAIYDCLDALGGAALVRRIEPAGHPALYESRVGDNHHHLVCRSCGTTADVDCTHGTAPCLTPADDLGFVVDEAEVIFWGLCAGCAAEAAGRLEQQDQADLATPGRPRRGPVGAVGPLH